MEGISESTVFVELNNNGPGQRANTDQGLQGDDEKKRPTPSPEMYTGRNRDQNWAYTTGQIWCMMV